MTAFKNILLCLDLRSDETPLIERGLSLAQRDDAPLTLLHVLEPPPGNLRSLVDDEQLLRLEKLAEHEALARMESMLDARRTDGMTIKFRCRQGKPFSEIILEAMTHKHDLVMVGADEPRNIQMRLFGGTTRRLVRKCPAPVWVVRAGEARPYRRVLASLALERHQESKALDRHVLEIAKAVAETESAELHLVHVIELDLPPFSNLTGEIPDLVDSAREQAHVRLDELTESLPPNLVVRLTHLRQGNPGQELATLAEQLAVDLVVLGTVGRTGIPGLLIGNTAEAVMQRVTCSLLAIKPGGFVSPVIQ